MACTLSAGRTQTVFGAGSAQSHLMLIGHGPSLTDDQTGLPYSGPAGDLLDTALTQAGLRRDEVWITNLHKCIATKMNKQTGRAEQRPPHVEEIAACAPWLEPP